MNYEEILSDLNAAVIIHEYKYGGLKPLWASDNIGDIVKNDKAYWMDCGRSAAENVLHPDDQHVMVDFIKAIEKDGYYHGFQRHKDSQTNLFFWVYVNFRPIQHDRNGNLEKVIGLMTYVGEGFHSPRQLDYLYTDLLEQSRATIRQTLTPREYEVTLKVCDGLTDRQIAECLHVSTHTVRNHRQSIFKKLGVHAAIGLVKLMYTPSIPQGELPSAVGL